MMTERSISGVSSKEDFLLTVVTPISGALIDFSKMQTTLKAAYGLPIKFRYIIDTPSEQRAEEIKSLLLASQFNQPEFLNVDVSAPGVARNFGLSGLQTDWTTFWDADDAPDVIEFLKMVDSADKSGFEVCLGNYGVFEDQTSKFVYKSNTPKIFPELGKSLGLNPGLWRFGFKSSLIDSRQFCELKMAEDQLFLAELNLQILPIYVFDGIVYNYYTGDKRHLTKNKKALKQLPKASSNLLERLDQFPELIGDFTVIMLSRQILTSIKKAPFTSKLKAIALGLKALFLRKRLSSLFLKSILFILLHSREYIDEAA